MRYTKKEESATEGGFLIIPKFEKTLTWFDEKSRAQLYAVIGQVVPDLHGNFVPQQFLQEFGGQVTAR